MLNSSRRNFLKQSAVITTGSLLLPNFLAASPFKKFEGKRLVVIQLSGGNDGLNTVIPFRNEILERARPNLFNGRARELKLTDDAMLNPVMDGLMELYDNGDLCILNGVGYPNPNRSHFRSMDIWHSASDSDEYLSTGWLGRYLDSECKDSDPVTAIEMGTMLNMALKGEKKKGIPLTNVQQFYNTARMIKEEQRYDHGNKMVDFLYKTQAQVKTSATYLYEKNKLYSSKKNYPNDQFGKHLKEVAEMIISGVDAPVYYASLSGFDTHTSQKGRQERLLKVYSDSVKVFVDDLKSSDRWNDTVVMTFSEFGRRVKENGSRGTDHGKANNMFLMGGALKEKGIYNELPDLGRLDEGDLSHTIDFRRIYATLLDRWLKADAASILGDKFSTLDFI